MKIIKPLQFFIFIVYTIFVLTLSFDSMNTSRRFRLFEYDKYIHFTEYLLFGMLLLNSIRFNVVKKIQIILISFFILFIPIIDESIQYFVPHRVADPFDLLFDYFGILAGVILVFIYKYYVEKNKY